MKLRNLNYSHYFKCVLLVLLAWIAVTSLGSDSQIVSKINLESDGDNVVSLLSQIGWTVDSGSSPRKRIQMEKILVILDSCGGNDLVSHLHGKIPHRESVISNTLQFLSE